MSRNNKDFLSAAGMTPEEQAFAKMREEHMAIMAKKLGNQIYDPEWHHSNFHDHYGNYYAHDIMHDASPGKGYDKIADDSWTRADAFAGTYRDVTGKDLVDPKTNTCNHCGMDLN